MTMNASMHWRLLIIALVGVTAGYLFVLVQRGPEAFAKGNYCPVRGHECQGAGCPMQQKI